MTTRPVTIYEPAIKVTLYKTIGRTLLNGNIPVSQRYSGSAATIDLTPYLSDGMQVATQKGIGPAAGGFTISLADKPNQQGSAFESLYGLIEPMDFIEIRMRHGTAPAAGAAPPSGGPARAAAHAPSAGNPIPIVMRGFVSNISRSQSMSGAGAMAGPTRSVTISGQDYGKLWQQLQILYLPGYIIGQNILSGFPLFERFGIGVATNTSGADFLTQVFSAIVNPYLQALMPANSPNPKTITIDTTQLAKHGTVGVTGPQNQEGTIHDLLSTYLDVGIWNELFIEDREDGVYCVWRPNPYLDVDGKTLIQGDATMPTVTTIPEVDIVAFDVERTDANVANYFWVRAPTFELNSEIYRKQFALVEGGANVDLSKYQNTQVALYGIRLMQAATEMGSDGLPSSNSGQSAAEQATRDTSIIGWITSRQEIMVAENKDNVVMEAGRATVRGNEAIRAGTYVRIQQGSMAALYYVSNVSHSFVPFGLFTTTLTLERGLGFVVRAQQGGGQASPYFVELAGDLGTANAPASTSTTTAGTAAPSTAIGGQLGHV